MSHGQLQLRLTVIPEADPIAGTVVGPDGGEAHFVGWMELAALLGGILEQSDGAPGAHEVG